jgi:hypothetical protein
MHSIGSSAPQQLAIVIDDVPLVGAAPDRYALQAVMAALDEPMRASLETLRERIGPQVGVLDSHFDEIPQLLEVLGLQPRLIAGEDLPDSAVRVAAIGCPHRRTRLDAVDAEPFFERGGILISSDKAARLPGVAAHVHALSPRGPARVRVATHAGDGHAPYAAAWLDAGHVPLSGSCRSDPSSDVLASDALSGGPLAVFARRGRGGLVHSVPHWIQVPHEDRMTAVERRPLRAVPAFGAIGNSFPGVSLGAFLSQRAMLRVLLAGLTLAVAGSPVDTRGSNPTEG